MHERFSADRQPADRREALRVEARREHEDQPQRHGDVSLRSSNRRTPDAEVISANREGVSSSREPAKSLSSKGKGFHPFCKRAKALVRSRGLEPPRCYPLAPETSASTNSATIAMWGTLLPSPR